MQVLETMRPDSAINWKNDDVTDMTSSSIFLHCFVSLVKLSYRSTFHVNIVTGSGVTTIFFVRDWPKIGKSEIPPPEFCPICGDWGELGIPDVAWMSRKYPSPVSRYWFKFKKVLCHSQNLWSNLLSRKFSLNLASKFEMTWTLKHRLKSTKRYHEVNNSKSISYRKIFTWYKCCRSLTDLEYSGNGFWQKAMKLTKLRV